jgi:hypothetical protein
VDSSEIYEPIAGSLTGPFVIVVAGRRVLAVESGIWIIKYGRIRRGAVVKRVVGILAMIASIVVSRRGHSGINGLLCERD